MTTDAISGKSQGREYIVNALWGLLLVIGAWIILNTINPKILKFTLETPPLNIERPDDSVIAVGPGMTPEQILADSVVRNELRGLNSNISVPKGPCTSGAAVGCTNVVGLQGSFKTKIQMLADSCSIAQHGCPIIITGGTEPGHTAGSRHYSGFAVDLRSTPPDGTKLNAWLGFPNPVSGNSINKPGIGTFTYEVTGDNGAATGAHWHLQ